MAYVRMPSVDSNVWIDPKSVLSLEFHNLAPAGKPAKKGKKAEPSMIIIPETAKRTPTCTLHLHNMQVVQFELPEDATEQTVLSVLDPRSSW